MTFKTKLLAAALVLTGAPAAYAAPNLVTDGGFDSSTLQAGTTGVLYSLNSQGLTGWHAANTAAAGKILLLDTPGTGASRTPGVNSHPAWALPNTDTIGPGGNFIEGDGDPTYNATLYQSISTLTVGQTYMLTFDYAGSENYPVVQQTTTEWWNVSLDASILASAPSSYTTPQAGVQKTSLLTTPGGSYSGWTTATMYFTATSTSEYLSFLAGGTPSGYPPLSFLDNVSLTAAAAPVPEPMTLSLLGAGLVGSLVAVRRARRRNASAV